MVNKFEFMSKEDYDRYNELMTKAEDNKKNAPKAERKPRGPLTLEEQKKRAAKKVAALEAKLAALLAGQDTETPDVID